MNNREKAREIAKEYRAVLAANTDFDVNDLDLAEEDATRLTLEMAEWKDQQFKEYLEKKMVELSSRRAEVGVVPVICQRFVMEIINELFGKK